MTNYTRTTWDYLGDTALNAEACQIGVATALRDVSEFDRQVKEAHTQAYALLKATVNGQSTPPETRRALKSALASLDLVAQMHRQVREMIDEAISQHDLAREHSRRAIQIIEAHRGAARRQRPGPGTYVSHREPTPAMAMQGVLA